jgi:regulator of cell morphogenesis and NO signaling
MSLEEKENLTAWQVAPLSALILHIVGTCHRECREDMAGLETLLALLAMEPGPGHLSLVEIRDLFAQFCAELRDHLAREERDLFPVLLAMERGMAPGAGKIQIRVLGSLLEEDHGREAGLLRDLRVFAEALAADLPADRPQARIHASMAALSVRFEEHVRLENEVLFPRMRR